ncbi:MAG TPA: hypothetical protein VFF69_03995 [Phycisphaerales bacterium]|nr:hypothetical protein [Phycisphaerales bacterium]
MNTPRPLLDGAGLRSILLLALLVTLRTFGALLAFLFTVLALRLLPHVAAGLGLLAAVGAAFALVALAAPILIDPGAFLALALAALALCLLPAIAAGLGLLAPLRTAFVLVAIAAAILVEAGPLLAALGAAGLFALLAILFTTLRHDVAPDPLGDRRPRRACFTCIMRSHPRAAVKPA